MVLAVVLLCGSAAALAGPIVFVGLVVPHGPAARGTRPARDRGLVDAMGPVVLLGADVAGRLVAQGEPRWASSSRSSARRS